MTLKQFLKPDWRKIVLFVVLLFIPLPIPIYGPLLLPTPAGITLYGYETLWIPFILAIWSQISCLSGSNCAPYFGNWIVNILFIIFILPFYYLLSCLIVWIYDKFRKNKVKKK
jgi:hypothetical protein